MKNQWTAGELSLLKRLYLSGASEPDIAKQLGRTVGSISNARQKHKIQRPANAYISGAPWTDEQIARAKSLYELGVARDVIASQVCRTSIAVKRMAEVLGWDRPDSVVVDPKIFNNLDEVWLQSSVYGYAVSNIGRVMSLLPGHAGKILKPWRDEDGYDHVTLADCRRSVRYSVHRLVALAFLPPEPVGCHQVAHKNGRPWDNRWTNLRWATSKENQQDRLEHGTATRRPTGQFTKVWIGDRSLDLRVADRG